MKFYILIIFRKILFEFIFDLQVNYRLTRFILRHAVWSKISQKIGNLGFFKVF